MSASPDSDLALTWPRLREVVRRFAASDQGRRGLWRVLALLALVLGVNGLNVVNSYVGRDFITALAERRTDRFIVEAGLYLAVFAASTVVAVYYRYTEERLGLIWRAWLTRLLIDSFLRDRNYHCLKQLEAIENPDERIAEDVKSFTTTTLSFLLLILNGTITIIAFSGVIWTISPLLFGVTLAYSAAGSYLAIKLGRPLIGLNYGLLDREANLRTGLVHLWENAEAVALGQREEHLRRRLFRRVEELTATGSRIIDVHRNLGFFTTGYNYLIQILPALVVAPLYLSGRVEFGVITQSAMAFAHLVGAFSLIVNQFQSISSFAAVVARLGSLGQMIESPPASGRSEVHVEATGHGLEYRQLTLLAAEGELPLIRDLSVTFSFLLRLGIGGTNERAKEALFKATAALAPPGSGRILRPPGAAMLFLGERPYLPPGSLRQLLSAEPGGTPEAGLIGVLREFALEPLVAQPGGWDEERDWAATLTLAQQQSLALAAATLARPRLVFLNRATSALSREQTGQVLRRLAETGLGYLFIGKLDKLPECFDQILELEDQGVWQLRTPAPGPL